MRAPRRLAAALLLSLLLAIPPARADLVYVLNSGEATVSLLDATTREEIGRLPVLRETHHLVLTPDRSTLLIGDAGGNEMLYLDPMTGEIRRRERFSNPYHMEFSPDGKRLVVTSLRRDQVDIYGWDGENLALQARLRMKDKPSHLAYSPDGKVAYVTLQGSKALAAIDLVANQPLWQMEVGKEPAGVIWHRGRLIVGIMGSDHFAVVNPETRQIERTIYIGRGAHTVFPSPDGKSLYLTSRVESRIMRVNAETLAPEARWDIAGGPDCIAFDQDGKLWVTLRWIQRLAVIDPATGEHELVRVGRSPHGVLVQARRGPDGRPLPPPVFPVEPRS
jgi:DNA-binding beta-propeller fold protein YncE